MSTGKIDEKYLEGLKSGELLLKFTWDEWLAVNAPFETDGQFSSRRGHGALQQKRLRLGHAWHALHAQRRKAIPAAFVFHGGAGSEKIMDLTPDGRPGLARF